jgi:hypothetical protein
MPRYLRCMSSTHELTLIICANCGRDTFDEETTTTELVRGKFALTQKAILLVEQSDEPKQHREVWVSLTCASCGSRYYDAKGISEWEASREPTGDRGLMSSFDEEEFLRALEAAKLDDDEPVEDPTDDQLEAKAAADRAMTDRETFAGYAEREPLLVSELLEDLGVANRDISDQIYAVLGWWQQHNDTTNRMLRIAVERWLNDAGGERRTAQRAGSMDGEDEQEARRASRRTFDDVRTETVGRESEASSDFVADLGDQAWTSPRFREIRRRLMSAASSRVHEYPPEKLEQLLDDARWLLRAYELGFDPDLFESAARRVASEPPDRMGDHPCPVLNCSGLDELGNCPMGYTRACMAK